jgi:hypothetical protein
VSEKELGRMIDPFILKKDNVYHLFFKQNGISYAQSSDLIHWEYMGKRDGGENACVIEFEDKFLLIHSPKNGIAFATSKDLTDWKEYHFTVLEQNKWEWANERVTAGFAMRMEFGFWYRYALFFHGSQNVFPETHGNASLAIAFTNDFKEFVYEM